jgi:hypothetical protein
VAFSGRILAVDSAVAATWGEMLAENEKHIEDAGFAATSIDPTTDLASVTRGDAITDSQRRHLAKPKARRRKGTALERR